jgi:hypothetical protein
VGRATGNHADAEKMESDMSDPTENVRREMLATGQPQRDLDCDHNEMIANDSPTHAWKCAKCGYVYGERQRWTTDELQRDFEVMGFLAPFITVKRKSDGAKGSMKFTHSPRVYFNFVPD